VNTHPTVVLYIKSDCIFCERTKELLDSKGVEYKTINIEKYEDPLEFLQMRTGYRSVPQIYINGTNIGNYEILRELYLNGTIDKLLNTT